MTVLLFLIVTSTVDFFYNVVLVSVCPSNRCIVRASMLFCCDSHQTICVKQLFLSIITSGVADFFEVSIQVFLLLLLLFNLKVTCFYTVEF